MGTDADLQQELDNELKPAARELAADAEAAKGRMGKVANDLAQALHDRNGPLIKLHLGTLNGLLADYAALVARGTTLLARLSKKRPNDERSAAGSALTKVTQALSDLQGRLDRNYTKLKQLQGDANKALAQAEASGERLVEMWAEMEAYIATNLKLFNTRCDQIKALHDLALSAQAERDAQDLAKIQSRNEERKSWKPTLSEINSRLLSFFTEGGRQLGPALRDQFTRDRVKFNKTVEELGRIDKVIDEHHKAIKGLIIKAIDPKRAAEAMEIPKGNDARVKKALDSSPLLDALGALAKDLKLNTTGAALLAKLKRAKLL